MSKRATVKSEEVQGLFPKGAPELDVYEKYGDEASGRDEEEYARRYGRPTTYRLSDALRDRIRAIADAEGVGVSELAEYILTRFVKDYETGALQLPKQQQEAYTLSFDELE